MGKISLTPWMIRDAVRELEMKRERVPLAMILSYLKRRYPVGSDEIELMRELVDLVDKAVRKGYLKRYGNDTFGIADMRWEATAREFGDVK